MSTLIRCRFSTRNAALSRAESLERLGSHCVPSASALSLRSSRRRTRPGARPISPPAAAAPLALAGSIPARRRSGLAFADGEEFADNRAVTSIRTALRRRPREPGQRRGDLPRLIGRVLIVALTAILAVHLFMRFDDHGMPEAASGMEETSSDALGIGEGEGGFPGQAATGWMIATCLAVAAVLGYVVLIFARSSRVLGRVTAREDAPRAGPPRFHPPWRPSSLVAQSVLILR